jgi:DNA-binding response OmpR family regulator
MSSTDQSLTGCRVLIVEDEYFLANDLEMVLKSHGATIVGPFADFTAAYRRATRDHFDVAIVDVNLRGDTAYPIADELIRQRIPFLFYTGYGIAVIPERFAGVTLLQKPLDPSALVEHIALLRR